MKKGIFWCKKAFTDFPELITVSVTCDGSGIAAADFSSKSGENFNHKAEWARLDRHVTEGYPFDHFPRGRVEIKNGKAVIFLNPDLCTERFLSKITDAFELNDPALTIVRVKPDGSAHYRHHIE